MNTDINLKKDPEGRFLEGRIGGIVFGKNLRIEMGHDYAKHFFNLTNMKLIGNRKYISSEWEQACYRSVFSGVLDGKGK